MVKDDFVSAVMTANFVGKGKDPLYTTAYTQKSKPTKKKYRDEVKSTVATWLASGVIPDAAILTMLQFFPKVVDRIPFFRAEAARYKQGQLSLAAPQVPTEYLPDTTLSDPVQQSQPRNHGSFDFDFDQAIPLFDSDHPMDLFEVDNQSWEDVVDESTLNTSKCLDQLLGPDLLDLLFRTNRSKVKVISFARILQHWCVDCKIPHEHVTKLLKLIKKFRATLSQHDIDRLPASAKTLLQLSTDDRDQVQKSIVKTSAGAHLGTYMHYGVETGVLGTSPGLYSIYIFIFIFS